MSSTGSLISPRLEDSSRGFSLVSLIWLVPSLPTIIPDISADNVAQRFRRALDVHGLLDSRPFKTPFQPWGAYYAIVVVSLLAITNGYTIFFPGAFTASGFLVSYVVFAIFFVLYFDHKIWYRTSWMVPAADIDIFSGKEEIDRL